MFHSCSFNISVNLWRICFHLSAIETKLGLGLKNITFNLRIERFSLRGFFFLIFNRFGRRKSKTSNWLDFRDQGSKLTVSLLIPYLWMLRQNSKIPIKTKIKGAPLMMRFDVRQQALHQRQRSLIVVTSNYVANLDLPLKAHNHSSSTIRRNNW